MKRPSADKLHDAYFVRGLLLSEIAKDYDVSYSTVHSWFKLYGFKPHRGKKEIVVDDESIVRLYSMGVTMAGIAEELATTEGIVRRVLRKNGVKPRDNSSSHKVRSQIRSAKRLRELYIDMKHSAKEIGVMVGVDKSTILSWLKEFGIERRKTNESSKIGASKMMGESNPAWVGGEIKDVRGYQKVRVDGKYIAVHILVAEEQLGRKLIPGEVVHHINMIQDDNRPENLYVCDQSAHRSLHHDLEVFGAALVGLGLVEFQSGHYVFVGNNHSLFADGGGI